MIYQTINTASQFRDAFRDAGRLDQFSYSACELLFCYLEESGQDYELDVVALCCEFYESSAEEIALDYSLDIEGLDDDEIADTVRDYLNDNTLLVGEPSDGVFLYAAF